MTTQTQPTSPDVAPDPDDVDGRAIVTLRMLAADAVQAAGSGHPGLPMGAAAPAYLLFSRFLRHDPSRPEWPDRDRFVLSAGHGSMLLYGLLHLFGYDLPLAELAAFRQWGSATPGHPEHGHTAGVETTTGPLGQGIGNAVGMALAERMLAAHYGHAVVDHRTFALASDGDLMEGVSHEAASLAGHLRLGRLVVLYDDNHITIDGDTALACSDDACARFAAYGWQVARVPDANDRAAVEAALNMAVADEDRPSLIAVRSHIGYGSPGRQDTPAAHGAPLGEEDLARTKARFGWPADEPFHVPEDVRRHVRDLAARGRAQRNRWEDRLAALRVSEPALAAEWDRTQLGWVPDRVDEALPGFTEGETLATRKASGQTLQALAQAMPELVGGSADLAESTSSGLGGGSVAAGNYRGRVLHFGVREHAMGAVCNGIALHRGLRPFASTFLTFSDYMRPAIRLAALMRLPVIYVFTHDSIGLGEDGPTHQPVEQLQALRGIPGLAVLRPADAHETTQAWQVALRRTDGPTALVLSRQGLAVLPPLPDGVIAQTGARLIRDGAPYPEIALVATGSEVGLALAATDLLAADGVAARVVSVPWRERFLASGQAPVLLPPAVPRLVIEAGTPDCWEALAGPSGEVIGLHRFGASAPGETVMARLGFTPDAVRAVAHAIIAAAAHGLP
jgi:transketolase